MVLTRSEKGVEYSNSPILKSARVTASRRLTVPSQKTADHQGLEQKDRIEPVVKILTYKAVAQLEELYKPKFQFPEHDIELSKKRLEFAMAVNPRYHQTRFDEDLAQIANCAMREI
ncbi:hypothetical protein LTR96_011980, partial [Exophiala xenobiotica]